MLAVRFFIILAIYTSSLGVIPKTSDSICDFKVYKLNVTIKCFHSRGQHLCKFIGTKESIYIRKEFNSCGVCLEDQHGRHFIV